MTERLRKILRGSDITPKTADETAVATAIENAGGGEGGSLPSVTAADDGKVLGVVDGSWAATDAPSGGGDVLRIPFTLMVDSETGTPSGTTDAVFADAVAAMEAGKILIAEMTLSYGAYGKQHLCAVMSGAIETSGPQVFRACATLINGDGTELELFGIEWTTAGVTVHGGIIPITS